MIAIGITGDIGSGKTTFADYLAEFAPSYRHLESSALIMETWNALVARNAGLALPAANDLPGINSWFEPLASVLNEHTGSDATARQLEITEAGATARPELYVKLFEYLSGRSGPAETITAWNKSDHRAILQWLGGYAPKRISGRIWYEELMRRASTDPEPAVAGFGGVRFPDDAAVIQDNRGLILEIIRPATTQTDANDITERERRLIEIDVRIINDSSLEDFRLCAKYFLQDALKHKTAEVYRASKHNQL